MRVLITVLTMLTAFGQNTSTPRRPLTIEEVVRQTKSGISEEIIVTNIKKFGRAFDLSTEEILELQRSGVSKAVIQIMLDPSQHYTPPPPPPPPAAPAPGPRKPMNPIAEKVPPESGMYLGDDKDEEFIRLGLRTLTAAKSKKMSSIFTGGLKKSAVIGYLVGNRANTRVSDPSPVFYLRLPEKVAIEEVLLVALTPKGDRREIELGPNPSKPVFPVGTVKQYESKAIDQGLFRVIPAPLEKGEYLFLLMGSADEKKGIVGKGYDFGL
jgi:hypothetical protein